MEYKKKCKNKNCNKQFVTKYPFQVYCCRDCKYEMDTETLLMNYHSSDERNGICKVCGQDFKKSKKSWVFCSDECRSKNKRKSNAKYEYECECCHQIFKSAIEGKKFCSERCRKIGKKKKIMSIEEIAKAARKEGITYGEYVRKYGV